MIELASFKINQLFSKKTVKGYPKKDENLTSVEDGYHIFGQNIKYQYPQKVLLDKKYLFKVTPSYPILAYASSTGSLGIIEESFYRSGDNGAFQALIPKFSNYNYRHLLYILTCLKKIFDRFNYASSINNIPELSISLPMDSSGQLNLDYMEGQVKKIEQDHIKELKQDRVKELEYYLISTKLNNYHLTHDEQIIITSNQPMRSFKLAHSYVKRGKNILVSDAGLFDIIPTKKKLNANQVKFGGRYPYIARGESDNGVRGHINYDQQYLNSGNTISFGQDTATMYYQEKPYFTGDKIQILKLNPIYGNLSEKIALYLISAMKKVFASYSWGQQSFSLENISNVDVELPVNKVGKIDFNYMEKYISAIQKLVIKDVVDYKDKVISETKSVIEK